MSVPASALQMGHISVARRTALSSSSCDPYPGDDELHSHAGNAIATGLVRSQVQLSAGLDLSTVLLSFLQRRGHGHGEAAGQRRKQALLGVGLAVASEAAVVSERRRERAAPSAERPLPSA